MGLPYGRPEFFCACSLSCSYPFLKGFHLCILTQKRF
jgi:hypothetical protein